MKTLKNKLSRIGLDGFVLAIGIVVCLAYFFPEVGVLQKPISLEVIANYAISGIFFFYGLKLNTEKLRKGLANWKMHLLIQVTTFIIFPLLILISKPFFHSANLQQLWLGIFFLAALPSTVSSSVVMVSIAGGNIPAAIFNASISALIGVIATPLWIGLFLQNETGNLDMKTIFLKLILQVLVPVILGIFLNKRIGYLAEKYKRSLKNFDQTVILIIIYISFSKSFTLNIFDNLRTFELIFLAAGMLVLFLSVMGIMKFTSFIFKFNREDTITVIFCGSKKSLVHGTVMAGILFAGSSTTGLILLPLMLYHALQLITASMLSKNMAKSAKLSL